MKRRAADLEMKAAAAPTATPSGGVNPGAVAPPPRPLGASSLEEAEERYVAAREAWLSAMRAANSGRPADLATLAIAQEAYEVAAAVREDWASGRAAVVIRPDDRRQGLDAVVGQELAWRTVLTQTEPPGILARIRRRLTGRD